MITVQGVTTGNEAVSEIYTLDDDVVPTITQGYGGWDDQERLGRRGLLRWAGVASWQQTIGVIMDASETENASVYDGRIARVNRQLALLRYLYLIPHPGQRPPLATLQGKLLPLTDSHGVSANWALLNMEPRQVYYEAGGPYSGACSRWAGVLTFGQVATHETIKLVKGPHAGRNIHVVKTGETLAQIARENHVKAADIKYASGKPIRDPRKIRKGDRLWLPPKSHAPGTS
jgi:hypothetical protein